MQSTCPGLWHVLILELPNPKTPKFGFKVEHTVEFV